MHRGNYEERVKDPTVKCLLPCKGTICRFNIDEICHRSIAYHPIWIEGKCQSFEYDD
ncbi:MAG: hypothetical protein ACFFCI_02150 [Promethearchaeota archaeon]